LLSNGSTCTATMRRETLPKLRAATLEGAAAAAAAARRAVARSAQLVCADGVGAGDSAHDVGEWRVLAKKVLGLVAPMSALAPHSGEVAEAKARALLCLGRFTEAVTCAEKEGLGGVSERENPNPQHPQQQQQQTVGGGGGGDGAGETGVELWRKTCLVVAHYAMGTPDKAVQAGAGAFDAAAAAGATAVVAAAAAAGLAAGATAAATAGVEDAGGAGAAAAEARGVKELLAAAAAQDARRAEGNASFKAGKFADAVASYTAAVAAGGPHPLSAAFSAVCLCNRAAAAHAEGRLVDALADCGRALALNPAHGKSLSRRAQVHVEVRLLNYAASDLELLLAVLCGGDGKGEVSVGPAPGSAAPAAAAAVAESAAVGMGRDQAQSVRDRLRDTRAAVHHEGAQPQPPDYYQILGLAAGSGASAADVKKGYRQLALKHHPDKSCNGLPAWADAESLRSDADRLFKLVGEANSMLSDG
jgi:tetratricopeptide (TPR) repeat protein